MREYTLNNGYPRQITYLDLPGGGRCICPTEQQLIAHGCKSLIRPEPPTYPYTETYTETETEIIVSYVEVPPAPILFEEPKAFKIKFSLVDLTDMLEAVPRMIDYISVLKMYHEDDFRCFYVNFFNPGERELIEYFGGVIYENNG